MGILSMQPHVSFTSIYIGGTQEIVNV